MPTVTVEEAQARLADLIEQLHPGEAVVITRGREPVARLVREWAPPSRPRKPGTLKGTVLYVAPDFDAPLDDFKDSME